MPPVCSQEPSNIPVNPPRPWLPTTTSLADLVVRADLFRRVDRSRAPDERDASGKRSCQPLVSLGTASLGSTTGLGCGVPNSVAPVRGAQQPVGNSRARISLNASRLRSPMRGTVCEQHRRRHDGCGVGRSDSGMTAMGQLWAMMCQQHTDRNRERSGHRAVTHVPTTTISASRDEFDGVCVGPEHQLTADVDRTDLPRSLTASPSSLDLSSCSSRVIRGWHRHRNPQGGRRPRVSTLTTLWGTLRRTRFMPPNQPRSLSSVTRRHQPRCPLCLRGGSTSIPVTERVTDARDRHLLPAKLLFQYNFDGNCDMEEAEGVSTTRGDNCGNAQTACGRLPVSNRLRFHRPGGAQPAADAGAHPAVSGTGRRVPSGRR